MSDWPDHESESAEGSVDILTRHPPRYAVLLHNDDYTTMEFVVEILERLFRKSHEEALQITLTIHKEGKGVAGVYPFEIAETKVAQVMELARERGFPLKASAEPMD